MRPVRGVFVCPQVGEPRALARRTLALSRASLLIAIAMAVGCGRGEPPPTAATAKVTAALNASPKVGDFVVEAQNSVRLATGGIVCDGGDIGARGTTGPFLSTGFALDAQTGVQVQSAHNLIADSVRLGTGDHTGDIQTNHFTDGTGTVHGTVTPLVPLPALPAVSAVTPGTNNLTVATGATVTAAAFSFATVSIGTGSTLRLPAGTYQVKDVTMSAGARIEATGAVQIHISNRLAATSGAFIGAKSGVTLSAKDIRIEVSGKNGTGGGLTETPKAVAFQSGAVITALLLVPNGTLALGTGPVATGAFMAKDVDVGGTGTHLVFKDGFSNPCTAASCDDGNPCTTDTCGSSGCTHAPAPSGTVCRASVGACDVAETCNSTSTTCPADGVASASTVCRAAAGECDLAETCTGVSATCPTDAKKVSGTVCSDDGNPCTKDQCDGANTTCQHPAGNAGAICRPANGACDVAEACTGTTTACPTDGFAPSTTTCRAAAGTCDLAETCSGSSAACPADRLVATGTICRAATGQCDVAEACTGTSPNCPIDGIRPDGSTCSDGNACTQTDACRLGVCVGSNPVTCTANDQCHTPGTCNPSTGVCSNPNKADGTSCNDGNACTQADSCQMGVCTGNNPVTCTASDQCHTIGTCNPATGSCSNPAKTNGTSCDDGSACTTGDTCSAGTCAGNPVVCTASDACHDVGVCAPGTGQCSNPLKRAGSPCGTNSACSADGQCTPLNGNDPPGVSAGPDQTASLTQTPPTPNFTLQRISTGFNNPVGIEYHQPTNKMLMSVNCCGGEPYNFELVNQDGSRETFSNIHGLSDEVYFAIARDEGGGHSLGGFVMGEVLVGTGAPGAIARVSPNGSSVVNPWVTLPGEDGLLRGMLYLDRTGLYGGDLIVTTTTGHLWRVSSSGDATRLATLAGNFLEGLLTVPNDPVRYGPWAGKILTGGEDLARIYAVDAAGNTANYDLGLSPENIMIVPPNENFFGVDYFGNTLWGASASQFQGMVGDIVVTEEFGGAVWHIHWNGASFETTLLTRVNLWEHTTFGPAGISEIPAASVQVTLAGSASDDGRPPGSTLSVNWQLASGPGAVTFADSHTATTTATFGQPGTYVLVLSATDGVLTATDEMTVTITGAGLTNLAPTVMAGPDQTITLPDVAQLSGSATDDGLPLGSAIALSWSQVSGPGTATFIGSDQGVTQVLFSTAGTYVLQLAATDGALTSTDQITIFVHAEPSLDGGSLVASLGSPGPLTTGATETLALTLTDSLGAPIADFPLQVTATGPNPATATVTTNASGSATFSYVGRFAGTDTLRATALGMTTQLLSNVLSVDWNAAGPAPAVTQGWIGSPIHQSTLTGQVPITVAAGITLTSGTVTYWAMSSPDQVHTLTTTAAGGPGTTLATLDTTTLANGSYVVKLDATSDGGASQVSLVSVTVTGDYKPGRLVVEVNEMTIPLPGMPLVIGRRYDSLEKDNVGDFGHGWSLTVGHPRLETDPAHNVTLTMLDGRRVTFYFQATSYGGFFSYFFAPGYVPEAGTFGSLTADGCQLMVINAGQLVCFLEGGLVYAPTTFTYTDQFGRVFTMAASGELKSIEDRQHNTLTFTPSGISSNTGVAVAFGRDGQGRITSITSPLVSTSLGSAVYGYTYDGNGDLATVALPAITGQVQYTYGAHRLLTTKDPRGNFARTTTYDASGRLATDTDALGNVTSYAYDLTARRTDTTNPDTGVVHQTFDDRGLLLAETDPLGRTTRHTYDVNRNELTRTNALNEVTSFTSDGQGNQTSITNARGEVTHVTYNALSQPVTSTDALGHATTIAYDGSGIPTGFTDSIGILATFTSTANGLPSSVTDAAGNTSYFTYDDAGNVTSTTDRLGRITLNTYDGTGHKISVADPRGALTRYTYSLRGTQVTMIDALGATYSWGRDANENVVSESKTDTDPTHSRLTGYSYDAANRVTVETYFDGTTTSYTRDFRGNKLTQTDESGRTTTFTYDTAGQLVTTTFPDGTFTTRSYDDLGRLSSVTDERGNTTAYEYQSGCGCAERMTKVTDALGRATITAYDAAGRRESVTDAAGHVTGYAYDARGHLTETDYADGTVATDVYDVRGRRTSHTDQMSATTTYGYDAEGQLTSVTDALGHVTQYTYDASGNLATVADANNHVTSHEYDPLNRKTKRTLPLGMHETFAYDIVGNNTSHIDFRGKTSLYTYDHRDRLLTKVPDSSLGEPTVSFTYFPTGVRQTMADASGATTYTYDTRNRLLTKATPAGALTYTYDPAGNVATIRSSNGHGTSVDYAWDAANQLLSVTDNRAGGVTTAAYTATGQPQAVTQPSGVAGTYTYDSLNRATSLAWRKGGGAPFASSGYTFNSRGQRLTAADVTGRTAAYGYDAVARLVSENITADPRGAVGNGQISYVLDDAANRLSRTSTLATISSTSDTYDANDQLLSDSYDANGNTIVAEGHSYSYDFENRLTSKDAGAVTIVYDGDGNRVAKTVGGVPTRYLVDDLNPTRYLHVLEEVESGAVKTQYTFGTMLVSERRLSGGSPEISYYGYDGHGNITFLTDGSGTVTDSYDYDAWGNLVRSTGTTVNSRLYAGEEFDPDLGLVNLRARYYSPGKGRFGTPDTFEPGGTTLPLSSNRYLYANGDPANRRDPRGLLAGGEYGSLVATGPTRAFVASAAGAGAGAAAGAVGPTGGAGVAVGVLVGQKTACNFQDGADIFAALSGEDVVRIDPFCPIYECTCACPVIDVSYRELLGLGLIDPLPGSPPKEEDGRGQGDSKRTAIVRCFKHAADTIFWADYNKNDYFDTDLRKCVVKACIVF